MAKCVWLCVVLSVGVTACGAPQTTTSPSAVTPWGTAHPYRTVALPPDGRWALICQARSDTNHDGQIAIDYSIHGDQGGDEMTAYLIAPDSNESVVENFLGMTRDGRWLAVVEHGRPVLIETTRWRRTPLSGTPPRFRITSGFATWRFSPDGTHLLFSRDGAPIVRDLASGVEHAIAPAAWSADWSSDGSWIELQILHGDTNHDGFIHGPDDEPSEGVPGNNCGHKFDWGNQLAELAPELDSNASTFQKAMDSLQAPDDLTVPANVQAIRSDGAVLIDGGPTTTDKYEAVYLRKGPLRWVLP